MKLFKREYDYLLDENRKLQTLLNKERQEKRELKRLLEAELKAKENNCHRGNYCGNCSHSVFVRYNGYIECICTYGQCEHFEKELEVVLKETCNTCNGSGAKPGASPETCPKCGGRGQVVYTQQSLFGMVQNVQTCPQCNGTGKVIKDKCSDCSGTGYQSVKKKISVTIPAGIDNGQSIRIREKGEPGTNGGPRGDLLVEVTVSRHPIFGRQDMHIFSTAPISFAQAALGGDVRIKTVDGDVLYTVAPGTKTDTKVRIRGNGVTSLRDKKVRGDHYVTLVVQTPENLSSEAKELLRKFDEVTGNSLNQAKEADGEKTEKKKKKGFMDKVKEAFED